MIPQDEHPEINFVGLLIGPRGNTLKNLEKDVCLYQWIMLTFKTSFIRYKFIHMFEILNRPQQRQLIQNTDMYWRWNNMVNNSVES